MPSKKRKNKNPKALPTVFLAVFCAVMVCSVAFVLILSTGKIEGTTPAPTLTSESTTEAVPEGPYKVRTVTVGSAGDVLLHIPVLNSSKQGDGTYNFDKIFTYVSSRIKDCDYFVANLETTLAGTENGRKYTGFPCFNSPDAILSSLKKAGVDCLLTANNHTYDTGAHGVKRTLSKVKENGFDSVGTRQAETDKKYLVRDIKGIKLGIACYTYETEYEKGKALNGIPVGSETAVLINSFDYADMNKFYEEIGADLTAMKSEGAEITMVYLHWGNEYQLTPDSHQKEIAQRLCDMGVDVIIGGHPHVVQPVDLISSADGTHKTVCVYSVGNMVSNQRRNLMGLKTGHTEDGLIFEVTVSEYSDGTVLVEKVKAVPTWVHLYSGTYNIVPLSKAMDKKAADLGLSKSSTGLSLAKDSYERTMELTKEGTDKCNKYLASVPKPDEVSAAPVTE
ncbi:MAG: CapA family protein [Clostridia bacterium]|nr:CapA family protein [Clostridia bacterium]